MTQHGKSEVLSKEAKIAWTTKTSMEKSRRHLGLETTISKRHQITIPHLLMQELGLQPRDKIRFQWMSKSDGRLRVLAAISREAQRIVVLRILVRSRVTRGHVESD